MTNLDQIADPIAATVWVLGSSALVLEALGGTTGRIAGGEVPKGWVSAMPQLGIVVAPAGGGGTRPGSRDTVPVRVQRLDVRCYAPTPHLAHQLALVVEHELQAWRSASADGVHVHWYQHVAGPIAYRSDPGDWPVAASTHDVQYARQRLA